MAKRGTAVPTMRFNHMEMTFPPGTLTSEFREEVDGFYGSVFGWTGVDTEVVGQLCHLLLSEEAQQFILLAESEKPMQSPGYDHLGLLFSTRAEVDDKLEECKRYQEKDDRVRIKEYDDLVIDDLTTRAFYVKYLLPIYFDVQCMERAGQPMPNALS
ncbi:MAG TPA: VOC family protein [Acidimicrobiia bacterium]